MTLRLPMLGSRMSYSANTPEPAQPPPFTLHMPNTAVVQAWLAGAINLITVVELKVHLQVEGGELLQSTASSLRWHQDTA